MSYEKIPESFSKWNLTESDYRAFKKTDWVVTEKIHGANFCITTNGDSVRFAKRQEFLQPDEDFFGFKSLEHELVFQVKEIFKFIQLENHLTRRVSVYGELFGGEYPHPDVAPVPNVQAVQTGIYYSPRIKYCAFDIAVDFKHNSTQQNYLDYDKAIHIFEQVGLLFAQPLFVGKYESAFSYNIEFNSTIPALLCLPKLHSPNKAEGVIIKPIKSLYLETSQGRIRPILKKKIPEFAEDSRFHQAKKWNKHSDPVEMSTFQLSQAMLALVTETRLMNVISKVGRISGKNKKAKEQVFKLFIKDVLETFNENYSDIFSTLNSQTQQSILEQLNQKSKILFGNYFNK